MHSVNLLIVRSSCVCVCDCVLLLLMVLWHFSYPSFLLFNLEANAIGVLASNYSKSLICTPQVCSFDGIVWLMIMASGSEETMKSKEKIGDLGKREDEGAIGDD